MPTLPPTKPRIAIYGVGQYGQTVARIAHSKGYPIVAAFNRAGDKVGQDLGALAGLEKIGVTVQDCDTADYTAVEADVCIVTVSGFLKESLPAYRRLMGGGMNIVSHTSEGYYPFGINQALANEIDEIAKANNVTYTGTGIWDMSRIWPGIMAAGTCTQIDNIFHRSITDLERIGMKLARRAGLGVTPEEFEKNHPLNTQGSGEKGSGDGLYKTIPQQVLVALGYTVTNDDVLERREPVIADKPYYCKSTVETYEPGTCLGTRMIVEVKTAEGPTAEAHIELRALNEDEEEHMMWQINGKPNIKVTVERDDSVYMSASSVFNRIHDVIAAEPGVKLLSELGLMKHSALI